VYNIDDYIDRAHARSATAENGYLPCARGWASAVLPESVRRLSVMIGRLN